MRLNAMHYFRSISLALLFTVSLSYANPPALSDERPEGLTIVLYDDNSTMKKLEKIYGRKKGKLLYEQAYGAKLIFLPSSDKAKPPETPRKVKGAVIYADPSRNEGPKWVVGDSAPDQDWAKTRNHIQKQTGITDISDKWQEYQFLNKFVPEMKPAEMHLASEYIPEKKLSDEKMEHIKKVIADNLTEIEASTDIPPEQKTRAREIMEDSSTMENLIKMESVRDQINNSMGKSILKMRLANHSEGKLPKSDKDWADLYVKYLTRAKPAIEALERKVEKEGGYFGDLVLKIPYQSGKVLQDFVEEPSGVVVQKMVPIETEVRLHIAEGEIIPDSTFLRFYDDGEYLSKAEKSKAEGEVAEHFISKLTGENKHFNATPDIFLLKGGGAMIGDLNDGLESGYYDPEEDLHTTNRLAEKLGGLKTPFIKEWDVFKNLPLNDDKAQYLKKMMEKYEFFMSGDVKEAWWDRVNHHYAGLLSKAPNQKNFDKILGQMKTAGNIYPTIYAQFLNMVQEEFPKLRLPKAREKAWVNYINKLNTPLYEGYAMSVDKNGRFHIEEKDEENTSRPAVAKTKISCAALIRRARPVFSK